MFISRKKFKALEQRIADLEGQVQGQQKCEYEIKTDEHGRLMRSVGKSPLAM